ncbi:MAG TPA: CHAP domain-containing protein [Solirubrobacteraceae bacterium]|jgi:hypothetical protein
MSVESVMARIAEIQTALAPRPASASGRGSFQAVLGAQTEAVPGAALGVPTTQTSWLPAAGAGSSSGSGAAIVQAAAAEVGQAEQPPGSNDSPRIAEYRAATAGSGIGPWCAYFASWAARQAGVPLGEQGQGFGAVSAVWDWAQRTGRALPAGSTPQPGDLIVWGSRHIGIVESVDASGSIHTIEGNSSDAVSRRTYGPDGGGATGYVHPG